MTGFVVFLKEYIYIYIYIYTICKHFVDNLLNESELISLQTVKSFQVYLANMNNSIYY